MIPLPLDGEPLENNPSCEGCGACCLEQGSPPGYALFVPIPYRHLYDWAPDTEDWQHWASMPDALKWELKDYYDGLIAGTTEDRVKAEWPCLWLDMETRRCRHYEHRPTICREFPPGSDSCGYWRFAAKMDGLLEG